MSGNGRAGNGRGNNRRRPFRHHKNEKKNNSQENDSSRNQASDNRNNNPNSASGFNRHRGNSKRRTEKPKIIERPKWTPPQINTKPLPVPDCSWCGKPIREISQAINDNQTGLPVHFDCVTARISENERLEKGDSVTYIGGGRFGIVNFNNSGNTQPGNGFKIKKIIEWEDNEKKAGWRNEICENFSVT